MFLLHSHAEGNESAWHVLLDTVLECLPLIVILFLTYLLMEWMEHRMGERTRKLLGRAGVYAPLLGGVVGVVPQCGFSTAASGLYAGRVVSLGTLFAVFLSTSDEMLPIALSHAFSGEFAPWSVLRILGGKLVIGIAMGMLIDLVLRLIDSARHHEHDHHHSHIGEMCHDADCGCEGGIFRSAFHHTWQIGLFIFAFALALNYLVFFIGQDTLAHFIENSGGWKYILSSLVGLIPNCAASVVVTELYISGAISLGGLYAGLLSGAGVGSLVLFRVNRPWWQNICILAGLFAIGATFGALIDLLGFDWLGLKFY